MIKAVLVDIDDTLLDFDLCAHWAMDRSGERAGFSFPEGAFADWRILNESLWKDLEKKRITKDQLFCARWNTFFARLGIDYDGALFEGHFLHFLSKSVEPVEGAHHLLAYLSQKYPVYTASNAPWQQQVCRMKGAGMDEYLTDCFVSERAGHTKPSREFFDYCFSHLPGLQPGETVMIGDSLTADIRGARDYGMEAIWFNKFAKEGAQVPPGVREVRTLREIEEIL